MTHFTWRRPEVRGQGFVNKEIQTETWRHASNEDVAHLSLELRERLADVRAETGMHWVIVNQRFESGPVAVWVLRRRTGVGVRIMSEVLLAACACEESS